MKEVLSFVVRIYRRDGQTLAGLVEQVRSGRSAPFLNFGELAELLSGQRRFTRRPIRRPKAANSTAQPATDRETT